MESTFRSPFSYGISNSSKRLPRNGLLIYLARPNSDEYLIGEDTEIGEDTYIWGYVLPDDSDIRAATGWVNGVANVFYTATGVPIIALATEIAAAILPANVVFSLIDATTQTGKLAIYTATTTEVTLNKARSVLRDESINRLFYEVDGIWYDPQDLTTMYQDASGTLPVYRPGTGLVDPPVGLMLDKGQGLELGPELVTNQTFDTDLSGWAIGTNASAVVVNGEAEVTLNNTVGNSANNWFSLISSAPPVNTRYRITIDATWVSGTASLQVASSRSVGLLITPTENGGVKKRYTCDVSQEANLNRILTFGSSVNSTIVWRIDNVSVREIKGYHAAQPTTLARPTLSGRYNLLTATETLSTQSVTTVAGPHTLRFEGTGTITLSGTATGTYSAGTHTITCTAGTLTCTVAGSVTKADLRRVTGQVLPVYQAVVNANTYDTAVFPLYLRRDLVDDDLICQVPTGGITGSWAHGTIDGPVFGTVAIPAGEYHPFGWNTAYGIPNCTQFIAVNNGLSISEQSVLERYVYTIGRQSPLVNQFGGVSSFVGWFRADTVDSEIRTSIDVTNWDVGNATSIRNLFYLNKALEISGLDNFNITSKCTNLQSSFLQNLLLQEIDISGWDLSSVTSCSSLFAACSSLETVIVGDAFDNTPCVDFSNSFTTTNLSQASIDSILVSINAAGTSNGTLVQSGGYPPSVTGEGAITAMRARGWNIIVTGGF